MRVDLGVLTRRTRRTGRDYRQNSKIDTGVNYARTGAGEPLVLLHGTGHRWQAWEPVIERLAEHHDVIAIDLPGFGASPAPSSGMPPDMPATVDAVADALADVGIIRPHVAGNSLGGAIALELGAAGQAASVTALSPAGFFLRGHRLRAVATLRLMRAGSFAPVPVIRAALRSRTIRSMTFGRLMTDPERMDLPHLVDDCLALRRGRGFEPVARASRTYQFVGVPTVPVTVAWAENDRILPVSEARVAAERLPKAHHVTLPTCGHLSMSDDPALVAATILSTTSRVR